MSYRVRPSFGYKIGVGSSNFRPDESVLTPTLWLVDVKVGWHHIEIPDHQDRDLELKKPGRVVLTGIPLWLATPIVRKERVERSCIHCLGRRLSSGRDSEVIMLVK